MSASSLQPVGYQLTKTSQVYGSKGSGDREMVPKYNHRALTRGRKWMTHFTYRRGRNVTTETEVGVQSHTKTTAALRSKHWALSWSTQRAGGPEQLSSAGKRTVL